MRDILANHVWPLLLTGILLVVLALLGLLLRWSPRHGRVYRMRVAVLAALVGLALPAAGCGGGGGGGAVEPPSGPAGAPTDEPTTPDVGGTTADPVVGAADGVGEGDAGAADASGDPQGENPEVGEDAGATGPEGDPTVVRPGPPEPQIMCYYPLDPELDK